MMIDMNKKIISFFALVVGGIGSYIPIMFGWDPVGMNGLSIFGGLVGGVLGIWLGVVVSQKYG